MEVYTRHKKMYFSGDDCTFLLFTAATSHKTIWFFQAITFLLSCHYLLDWLRCWSRMKQRCFHVLFFFLLIKVCFPLWLNVSVGGWINSTSLRPFINFFNFKFGFWKSGNALHNEICCCLLFNKAAPVFF